MPEHRGRSLIFPVILILVGLVFLADQLGLWSLDWGSLWKFWPLILVFVGLDLIFRNTRARGLVSLLVAVGLVALVAILLLSGGAQRRGVEREAFSYPLKGLESATVRLEVGVGRLEVSALDDSDKVLEADISHDARATRLVRDVSDEERDLRVSLRTTGQTRAWQPFGTIFDEDWRIGLTPKLPVALDVNSGVNRSRLDLRGLRLTQLDLNAGVGDMEVMLPDQGTYQVSINGGVGAVKIEIPEDVEARIRVDGGLGAVNVSGRFERQGKYYVSKGYANADDKVEIDVDGGVGSITIH